MIKSRWISKRARTAEKNTRARADRKRWTKTRGEIRRHTILQRKKGPIVGKSLDTVTRLSKQNASFSLTPS